MQRRFRIRQILLVTGISRVMLIASFAISGQPLILGGLLAAFIMLAPTANTAVTAIRNKNVPAEILGKVTASTSFVATGLQPLAPLFAGLMLATVGKAATALTLSGLMLLIVAYISKAAGFKEHALADSDDSHLANATANP